ncbi:MAG: hypothetical protein B7Z66_11110 [Chromatiales bacterium 21-64-14]|nr:MAG: hypothetical protein B7Z66_11110 [Chromatiales bacterium 21-64-14]HQU16776.1 hypothetical protein [Gammaproteobacteria bacterium]
MRSLAAVFLIVAFAPAARAAGPVDLAGIQLGMSPTQAIRAIQTLHRALRIRAGHAQFPGDPHPYVDTLIALLPNATATEITDDLGIAFATPPTSNEAMSVFSDIQYQSRRAPTLAEFRSSLISKYGRPAWQSEGADAAAYRWLIPAQGMDCLDTRVYQLLRGFKSPWQPLDGDLKRTARDPARCASVLTYDLRLERGRVAEASAHLIDVAASLASTQASSAYLQKLRNAAP